MEWIEIKEKQPPVYKNVWVYRSKKIGRKLIVFIFKAYYKGKNKWSYIFPNEKNLLINPFKWKEF